jgi:hypothetical protein
MANEFSSLTSFVNSDSTSWTISSVFNPKVNACGSFLIVGGSGIFTQNDYVQKIYTLLSHSLVKVYVTVFKIDNWSGS